MKKLLAALLLCVLHASVALAMEPFVIKDIRVDGVQRISAGTVFNYLPVKVGDTEHYTQSDSKQKREAVRKLESALIPKPRKRSA